MCATGNVKKSTTRLCNKEKKNASTLVRCNPSNIASNQIMNHQRLSPHISNFGLRGKKHVYASQGVGFASPTKATTRSMLFCQHYAYSAPDAFIELLASFCKKSWFGASSCMSKALQDRIRGASTETQMKIDGTLCFLTAEFASDGQLAGFVSFQKLPSNLENSGSCRLCDVVVAPSYRNQGIGSSLVRHCLAVLGTDARVKSVVAKIGRRGGSCSPQIEAVMKHNGFGRKDSGDECVFHFSSWPQHQRTQNLSSVVAGPASSNLLRLLLEKEAKAELDKLKPLRNGDNAGAKRSPETNQHAKEPATFVSRDSIEESGERFATAMETSAASVLELTAILRSKNDLIRRLQTAVRTLNSKLSRALAAQQKSQQDLISLNKYIRYKPQENITIAVTPNNSVDNYPTPVPLFATEPGSSQNTLLSNDTISAAMRANTLYSEEFLLARERELMDGEREHIQKERNLMFASRQKDLSLFVKQKDQSGTVPLKSTETKSSNVKTQSYEHANGKEKKEVGQETPQTESLHQDNRERKTGWAVLQKAVLGSSDKVQQLKERLRIEQEQNEAAEEAAVSEGKSFNANSPKVYSAVNSALEVGQASLQKSASVPSSPEKSILSWKSSNVQSEPATYASDLGSLEQLPPPVEDQASKPEN